MKTKDSDITNVWKYKIKHFNYVLSSQLKRVQIAPLK